MKHELKKPLKRADDSEIRVLNMREDVTLGDMLAIEGSMKHQNDVERTARSIQRLCGLDEDELEQIAIEDYTALVQKMNGGAGPKEPTSAT